MYAMRFASANATKHRPKRTQQGQHNGDLVCEAALNEILLDLGDLSEDIEIPYTEHERTTALVAQLATLLDSYIIDPFATFSDPLKRSTSFLLKHCMLKFGRMIQRVLGVHKSIFRIDVTVISPSMYATKGFAQSANSLCM